MYTVQTYEEVLSSLQNSAKEQFGDEFNVSSTSNWHRILGLPLSLLLVEKSQNIKDLEDRMSVYKAAGQDLDDLLNNFLFPRKQSTKSTGTWTTTNSTPNTVVSIGSLTIERAVDGITYKNTNAVTIDGTGLGVFEIECETSGSTGNCEIGAIDKIKTPVAGIVSGTNTATLQDGQNQENDLEYLARYLETTSSDSYWNLDGIYSEILKVDGVTSAFVSCNRENVVDSNGWEPHSRVYVVEGGTDKDVAEAIYRKTDRAIQEMGDVEVSVQDIQGNDRIVKFYRPTNKTIFFKVSVLPSGLVITTITDTIKEYIDSVKVGGLITQTNAVETVRSAGLLTNIQSLDIQFSDDGLIYSSIYQLDYNKKAVGSLVTV